MHEFIDKEAVDLTGKTAITALIDADSIAYIVGYSYGPTDEVETVLQNVDNFVSTVLAEVQARQYAGFLSPKKTFRHDIYPAYKQHRKEPHPNIALWRPYINEHLRQMWGFVEWENHEADDAVSLVQNFMENCIICSPDKDLKQVVGNIYDYKKQVRMVISQQEAWYNWAYQMLLGDSGDNIKGCPGVGKVGAEAALVNLHLVKTEEEVMQVVYNVYERNPRSTGDPMAEFELSAKLITTRASHDADVGELSMLQSHIHTFDLDAAGTSSYLAKSDDSKAAEDIFGEW